MIKSFILTLATYAFFSITLYSQSYLTSEDCHSLTATFETLGAVHSSTKSEYSFILEKAILPNLWQKKEVVNTHKKEVRFADLPPATYRVTVISPTYFKTKLHHHLIAGEKENPIQANTFLSNIVVLDSEKDCKTGHPMTSKRTVQTKQSQLALFPNPTHGIVWVEWNNTTPIKTLSIYSLTGKLLRSITPTSSVTAIDLSAFEAGVYLLKATAGSSMIATERISVIR